jgi:site-specific DNA-cytosine methylase
VGGHFRIAGAVDFDRGAAADFEALTGAPCTVADLASMTPEELRAACPEPPDVVFTSPPCKSFSGCLPAAVAASEPYQAMASLAVRGLWLALEAFAERPPLLILMENVPRIQNRGRELLDQVVGLLRAYGYVARETVHDCGELGGLGQRRRRFLLVARHAKAVPNFWFEPPSRGLRPLGQVLGELPVPWPRSAEGGPMHRLPRLSALNWVRLALVPPGGDWRDLPPRVRLVESRVRQNGGFGVEAWSAPAHAVLAEGTVHHTRASVADPRLGYGSRRGTMGVSEWAHPAGTVIGASRPDKAAAVADPRLGCSPRNTVLGVSEWDSPSGTVIAAAQADNGAFSVADPRPTCEVREGAYGVTSWDRPSTTVIAAGSIHNGPWQVADPRGRGLLRVIGDRIEGPADELRRLDLADPRPLTDPPLIVAADGTWHRPMTTLELAALQGLPIRQGKEWLRLEGSSHSAWRQRIGNAVPPPTAEAIAETALRALVAADLGVWELGGEGVWVSPPENRREDGPAVERGNS